MRALVVTLTGVLIAVGFTVSGAGATLGPANDDFANATVVPALPFDDAVDTTLATTEVGEPQDCAPVGATAWYRFTPEADAVIVADTAGSNFDTVVTVYTGDSLNTLQAVDCNDDTSDGLQARVGFRALGGQTYHVQVGGYGGQTGSLMFGLDLAGAISGTVTTEAGDPLADVCVDVWDAGSEWDWVDTTVTGADGTYVVAGVAAGDYKVSFFGCGFGSAYYADEWYDNQRDFFSADVVTVAAGQETAGINGSLAPIQIVEPVPTTDLAVTGVSVENVSLRTDQGDTGLSTGWSRRVHVEVSNLGEYASGFAYLEVVVCPETFGVCRLVGSSEISLDPGADLAETFKWNGAGSVGDVTVTATLYTCDIDERNNEASVDHYVMVGGTGFGIDATGWPGESYDPYPHHFAFGCGGVIVFAASG